MQYLTRRTAIVSGIVAIGGLALGTKVSAAQQAENGSPTFDASKNPTLEKIAPYKARFGRARPLVAVVALNEGTVISDFCIPFGVMARADVADVVSVSVKPGPVKMHPLTFELQSTIDDFDKRFPRAPTIYLYRQFRTLKTLVFQNGSRRRAKRAAQLSAFVTERCPWPTQVCLMAVGQPLTTALRRCALSFSRK